MKQWIVLLVCLLTGFSLTAQEEETQRFTLDEIRIRAYPPESSESSGDFEQMLYLYWRKNITYPPAAIEKRAEGKCYALFTVTGDGSVTDVSIARGVPGCPECDSAVLTVLQKMPRWRPRTDSLAIHYSLPVRFDPSDIPPVIEHDPPLVYDGHDPVFPGGHKALIAYLQKEIIYPKEAAEKGIGGKVFLRFIVSKTGKVSNVEVTRGIPECPECDAEAVRVVKAMPLWIPEKIKGEPVDSWMSLPVKFDPQKAETE